MTVKRVVLATRRSKLALAQARAFARSLIEANPGLEVEELHVVTTGDRIQDRPLTEIGGKGLFIKEIEQALMQGRADMAVHSIKDVPGQLAPGLQLACIPQREDPRDVFLSRNGESLETIAHAAHIGTSSARRRILLERVRPDFRFEDFRGNVDTRMQKLQQGVVDATVLASAGLRRLGLSEVGYVMAPEVCLPAVGQGALGIECRDDDEATMSLLSNLHDLETAMAVVAERGVMIAAEGSCQVPIAAYACKGEANQMWLRAMLASPDATRIEFAEKKIPWPRTQGEAAEVGEGMGRHLREKLQY